MSGLTIWDDHASPVAIWKSEYKDCEKSKKNSERSRKRSVATTASAWQHRVSDLGFDGSLCIAMTCIATICMAASGKRVDTVRAGTLATVAVN